MSFGYTHSDAVNLIAASTRVYATFKDISGKDIDANLHAIRREYIGLHQVLLELESLMRVYNRPLPFPYLDLQATVEKCGKFLAPEKESGSKSFTYTLKRFNKRSEIDQLRTQLAGHSQALNICISFLQLRLHLEATKQTQRLLDSVSSRINQTTLTKSTLKTVHEAASTLALAQKTDQLSRDHLSRDYLLSTSLLENENESIARAAGSSKVPPYREESQTKVGNDPLDNAEVILQLRKEVEDATSFEEDRLKSLPEAPQRRHILNAPHSDDPSIPEETSAKDAIESLPYPSSDLKTPDMMTASDMSTPNIGPSNQLLPIQSFQNPSSSVAQNSGSRDWVKLCRKVRVERVNNEYTESTECDLHWRYREDGGLSIRSVYRHEKQTRLWITQHFPAACPPIPFTAESPDGDVMVNFPKDSFGNLGKQYTNIRYTFTHQEQSVALQTLLYTNNGLFEAELLFDRPIITVSSNLNKPECRGGNVRLWRRREKQKDDDIMVQSLVLLLYTSDLPDDRAHWVEEPHYAFEPLDYTIFEKNTNRVRLVFAQSTKHDGNKSFMRWNIPNIRLEHGKDLPSWPSVNTATSFTSSSERLVGLQGPQSPVNRFGYSELEIHFSNRRDKQEFGELWRKFSFYKGPNPSHPMSSFISSRLSTLEVNQLGLLEMKSTMSEPSAAIISQDKLREKSHQHQIMIPNGMHWLPDSQGQLRSGAWKYILDNMPKELRWDLEFTVPFQSQPCWTLTPSSSLSQDQIPLTIAGAPVIIPVPYEYEIRPALIPPPDPHPRFISPNTPLPEEAIEEIFETYHYPIGFYLLLNGWLQIIVDDDFDYAYALSHLPQTFGGLRVSYIAKSLRTTASRTTAGPSMGTNDTFTTIAPNPVSMASIPTPPCIGGVVEARVKGLRKAEERFQGRIGIMTECENKFYVTVPTHLMTEAWISAKGKSVPEVSWINEVAVSSPCRSIEGLEVAHTFDPDVKVFPSGFEHDVSLIDVTALPRVHDGLRCPYTAEWISDQEWNTLSFHYPSTALHLLSDPERAAKNIPFLDSENMIIGQAIFNFRQRGTKKPRRKWLSRSKKPDSQPKAENWRDYVAHALLFRIERRTFRESSGASGTAVCVLNDKEDGSKHAKIAGFTSFVQDVYNYSRLSMDDDDVKERLRENKISYYDAFRVPKKMREEHRIITTFSA